MIDIRALRRSRGLTLTDLALLSGIPARTLAEIEHGLRWLDTERRARLAQTLNVPPQELAGGQVAQPAVGGWGSLVQRLLPITATKNQGRTTKRRFGLQPSAFGPTAVGVLLLAGMLLFLMLAPARQPLAQARPAATAAPPAPTQPPRPTQRMGAAVVPPTATPAPTPTPSPPRFWLAADGPHGCPLAPSAGQVVLTQGYSEGTHLPTAIWGAVDLAIDGDGDGEPEPPTTQGQPIAATHAGVAHVYLGTWPAGNYVRVADEQSGWSSAYAHLDGVAVQDGQAVRAGDILGSVGSTGMASGPHLHYEVWRGGVNIDPTGLIGCG